MPTDLAIPIARRVQEQRDSEAAVLVGCLWLVFYLLMLIAGLSHPSLAQAIEFAARY